MKLASLFTETMGVQSVDVLVLALFVCFAIVFHANYRLFAKMLNDMFHLKERQSPFVTVGGNEWFFRNFMTVQALLLCGICLFAILRMEGFLDSLKESVNLWVLSVPSACFTNGAVRIRSWVLQTSAAT